MIVNTTGARLNLNQGAVSKAIYSAVGASIQDEVDANAPNGLKAGQMVSSSGGNLACKKIYHTFMCDWDHGQGAAEQVK